MSKKVKIIASACGVVGVAAAVVVFLFTSSKTFNVSFDTDGGSSIPTQTIKKGEKVNKPSNPTKEEYSFVRWEYQNKEYDFNSPVESNMTLKAIWEKEVQVPKYKVTFTVDGIEKTIEVSKASEINVSNFGFEEKDGYVLKWYVNDEEYDLLTPITNDISIEGKYEKTTTYTVKFNSNGGTKVNNQVIAKGGKVTEPTDVKKEGYILDGWYLGNNKYDFNTEVNKNITLSAKWSEDPNVKRYKVTFNTDGGSKVSSQKVIENKKATKPSNPTKSGYAFDGWYLDKKKYDFNLEVTSDITLIAKWRELEKYTVTFDSNGGSSVSSQTVIEGSKAKKPTNPTKKDYDFVKWTLDGNEYNFDKVVTKNITLVAIWKEKSHTYSVIATKVDNFSTDSRLTVKKDGVVVNTNSISYIKKPSGSTIWEAGDGELSVATKELSGLSSLKIKFTSGEEVMVSLTIS